MASDTQNFTYDPSKSLFAVISDHEGRYASGTALETFDAAHWLAYRVAIPEVAAGTGQYAFTSPALPAGSYSFEVYEVGGGTPSADPFTGISGDYTWDGAAFGGVLAFSPSGLDAIGTVFVDDHIHVGDVGPFVVMTVKKPDGSGDPVDLSASTVTFTFQKPDDSTLDVEAAFNTDGTDGVVQVQATDGLLDQEGTWRAQALVVTGSQRFHSDVSKFKVLPNLPL